MEITLKFENLSEVNEVKEWFKKKLADTAWVDSMQVYFQTHRCIITQQYFDHYLCVRLINAYIEEELLGGAAPCELLLSTGGIYTNVYSVLYEIYKTMQLEELDDEKDSAPVNDVKSEEKVEYKTESTFEMPNIKNSKFMI